MIIDTNHHNRHIIIHTNKIAAYTAFPVHCYMAMQCCSSLGVSPVPLQSPTFAPKPYGRIAVLTQLPSSVSSLKEGIKYYFVYLVRKEGTSPLPLPLSFADKMFMEKLTRKGQQCF